MRRPAAYRAQCSLCNYIGLQRPSTEAAFEDQERHADSREHQQAIIERDRPRADETADSLGQQPVTGRD